MIRKAICSSFVILGTSCAIYAQTTESEAAQQQAEQAEAPPQASEAPPKQTEAVQRRAEKAPPQASEAPPKQTEAVQRRAKEAEAPPPKPEPPPKTKIRDVDIVVTQPGEWREKESERNGFGFGTYKSFLLGWELFYDYQLTAEMLEKFFPKVLHGKQISLHAYYSFYNQEASGILFEDYYVKTNATHLGATLRYFPSAKYGWYFGGGSALTNIEQETSVPEYCSTIDQENNHEDCKGQEGEMIYIRNPSSLSGLSLYGETGWQGYDGYYFTIGLRLGATAAFSEDNNTDDVPEESDTAKKQWEEAKNPSAIIMLFGWHF